MLVLNNGTGSHNASTKGELDKFLLNIKIGVSSIKHDTGIHINLDNFSVAASGSYKFESVNGHTALGIFGEYGHGSYDVSNGIWGLNTYFSNYKLKGTGDTDHYGGGVLLRNEFMQGTYLEASARVVKWTQVLKPKLAVRQPAQMG